MAMIAPAPRRPVDGGDHGLAAMEHRLDQIARHPGEGQKLGHRRPISGPMISCTSPPEQKLPPCEAKTTTSTSLAWESARNVSRSSA